MTTERTALRGEQSRAKISQRQAQQTNTDVDTNPNV